MGNLPKLLESDLAVTLEKDFGLPVEIVYLNGAEQVNSKNNPLLLLYGRVQFESKQFDLVSGGSKLLSITSVSIRISSLDQDVNQVIFIRVPTYPDENAPKQTMASSIDNQPSIGRTLGFVTFYLEKVKQTVI